MASSALTISFLLLSISTLQIHARDSQFFSKVTTETPSVILPDKALEQQSLVNKPETEQTQQPEFVPQNESGYGLYGHETGLNAPESDVVTSTTTNTDGAEKYYNNDKNDAFTKDQFSNDNSETLNDESIDFDDVFDNSKYGKGETFYTKNDNGVGTEQYTTESLPKTEKDSTAEDSYYNYNTDRSVGFGNQLGEKDTETYYNDNRFDNRFTDELNSRYKAYRGESSAGERKGMSDTRFLENGKYYYDLEKEQQSQYDSVPRYNRAYGGQRNEVVGDSKYDDVASYDNSGGGKYEFDTMEEYEKSSLRNQYDP